MLQKRVGETPLAALRAWQAAHPEVASAPVSYAGRLDPMASGKLLVLVGDECKRQAAYTKLDKEYEVEILLDVSSDTGDVLGLPHYANTVSHPQGRAITRALAQEVGVHECAYPVFSSKTVKGKPLFMYALEGSLSMITVPTHEERIYSIQLLSIRTEASATLREHILKLLELVPRTSEPSKELGENFRVEVIRPQWEKLLGDMLPRDFVILRVRVACGSGAYMRSLASRIGESLGTKALALSISRTTIGRYLPLPFTAGLWLYSC